MQAIRRSAAHRHTAPGQHEHEFEPQRGLPEALPAGEALLWQGSPDWWALAVHRFHVRKLAVYFALLLVARLAVLLDGGTAGAASLPAALLGTLVLFSLAVLALGAVLLMAWLTARTSVYTLTNRRVVMRIGIVLTVTLNLPYSRVVGASMAALAPRRRGPAGAVTAAVTADNSAAHNAAHSAAGTAAETAAAADAAALGDIALQLQAPTRLAYLQLWPHARAWRLRQPEPTLLCLPHAALVAAQLTAAWRSDAAAPASGGVNTGLVATPTPAPAGGGTGGAAGGATGAGGLGRLQLQ